MIANEKRPNKFSIKIKMVITNYIDFEQKNR